MTAVARPAADRAAAYGLEPIVIDGNDADAVYLTARSRRSTAPARGGGPSLIEAVTYRHGGHSRADPGKYRPKAEVDAWAAYDPITVYRGRLLAARRRPRPTLDAIDKEVADAVDARDRARPSPATARRRRARCTDVWADGGSSWRN